jgi:tRNA-modifying protein YgfZ
MVTMASATQNRETGFSLQVRADRAVVSVRGEGALAFLQNLLTADLATPHPAYGALLTPQGKILHDLFVVPDGDTIWLDVAKVQAEALLKRLVMYRLRAKLDIGLEGNKAVGVASSPDLPGASYPDPRLPAMGYRTICEGAAVPSGDDYDAHRILHGIADSVLDISSGELFGHEANLDQLNGVSFTKGCYVGQEVVSRTHHRSSTRSRIMPVTFSGTPRHGEVIEAAGQRIGTMLSSAGERGLALLRLDRLAEAKGPAYCADIEIKAHKPAWARFEVAA